MRINFKTFCELEKASSEQQIDEIFGKFFGKEPKETEAHKKAKEQWLARKAAQAEKQKSSMLKKTPTGQSEKSEKEKEWDEYRARASRPGNAAARGRAAELDWSRK